MRGALALVLLAAACHGHSQSDMGAGGDVLWLSPGESEENYVLSTIEPNPF